MRLTPVAWTARTVSSGSFAAANVGNGSYGDAYSSNNWFYQSNNSGAPFWVKADYGVGTPKIATRYSITPTGRTNESPDAFTFEGSNDDATWTTLDTRTAQGVTWPLGVRHYTFTNTTAYRYYRLNASATGGTQMSIAGLEIGNQNTPSILWKRDPYAPATISGTYTVGIVFKATSPGTLTHYSVWTYYPGDYVLKIYDASMNVVDAVTFNNSVRPYEQGWQDVPLSSVLVIPSGVEYMVTVAAPSYSTGYTAGSKTTDETFGDLVVPTVTTLDGRTFNHRSTFGNAVPTAPFTTGKALIGVIFDTSPRDFVPQYGTAAQETIFTDTRIAVEHTTPSATQEVVDFTSVTTFSAIHNAAQVEAVHETKIARPVLTDALTGKAPYRLIVVDRSGQRFADLDAAKIGRYTQNINGGSTLDFTVKMDDPKISELLIPQREIQFWRGAVLEDWLVLLRGRKVGDGTANFTCTSQDWYFDKRVIGKVPIPNLLKNGSFEEGKKYWDFSWVAGSIPSAAPINSLNTSNVLNGLQSLEIEGSSAVQVTTTTLEGDTTFAFDSATLTSAGISAIDGLCNAITVPNPKMKIVGHTDSTGSSGYNYSLGLARANSAKARVLSKKPSAIVSVASYGETRPVASNSTSGGRAKNRRVEIDYSFTQTAKGHRQYAGQSFTFVNPSSAKKEKILTLVGWTYITQFLGPSKDGWGVYIQLIDPAIPKKPVSIGSVSIDAESPKNRWTRMECSVKVPANDKAYRVDVRLYPPEGKCIWDEIGVTSSDQLAFFDVDQALIVKGIVEHAQDPAMGKSDIGILTNTPLTGVKRTREFPWIERMMISDALNDFPTLADGMDITYEFTPTTKTLRTHHPRKASFPAYVFSLGSNVASADSDIDGQQTTTQVIVQAEGDGSDREEGVWTDTSVMGGLILETVYNATPGSSVSSLTSQAKRGVKRWAHPIVLPTLTMNPDFTEELLQNVSLGDVVHVIINDGWLNLDGMYRITSRSLDAVSDQITYEIVPEVELT